MTNPQFAHSGEMVTATLRGYRAWSLQSDELRKWKLGAVSVGAKWKSKEITAECMKPYANPMMRFLSSQTGDENHDVPVAGCTCGIYGWYEPENAMKYHTGTIMGVVEFSGRILMGTMGFRAEKAKIVGITFGSRNLSQLQETQKAIHFIKHLEKYIQTHEGVTGVDFGKLQGFLAHKAESERTEVTHILEQLAKQYGIAWFRSTEELKKMFPPQLDTVENVLGNKLKRYTDNGSAVF